MSLNCAKGKKIIEWQYSGESLNRILGADNYKIERSWYGGQDPDINYRLKYKNYGLVYYSSQPASIVPPISAARVVVSGNVIDGYYVANGRGISTQVIDSSGSWKQWLYNTRGRPFEFIGFEPADGSIEENPGGGECNFTITKNNTTVYQEARSTCPVVNEYCQNYCPPNTCECQFEDRVCCIDPQTGFVIRTVVK